jgi:hypothetical protein
MTKDGRTRMDLVDRKAVLEAIRLGMTVTQLEREVMAIPGVAVVPLFDLLKAETRIRQLEEERLKAVPDFSEDRSAIQGTNPGLAELIKERQEAIAREATRQEALSHEEKQKIVDAWHGYHRSLK